MSFEIRPATAADAERIAQFNRCLAEETEGKSLDAPTVLSGVQALLDAPERGCYYVADSDGVVAGQLYVAGFGGLVRKPRNNDGQP